MSSRLQARRPTFLMATSMTQGVRPAHGSLDRADALIEEEHEGQAMPTA
jgi:hypothetical protein